MARYRSFAEHLAPDVGPKRILALDGGGLRGVLTLGMLREIETLLRANDLPSKRALNRILRFGRRDEHHNYMAIIWNKPLRQLRGLIARHPRYRMEFSERSIP